MTGQVAGTRQRLIRFSLVFQKGGHFRRHPLLDLPAVLLLFLLFLSGDVGRIILPYVTGYRLQLLLRGTGSLRNALSDSFRRPAACVE